MKHKQTNVTGHQVGIFLLLAYAICLIWYIIHPNMRELHIDSLKLMFFGFSGMNIVSMVFGAIQSYIWGYIGVFLWGISVKMAGNKK